MSLRGPAPIATRGHVDQLHSDGRPCQFGGRPGRLCLLFLLFVVAFITVVFYSTFILEHDDRSNQISVSVLTEYDSIGCNGITLDMRVAEMQRILSSVRRELLDSSSKLEDVNKKHDEIAKETLSKKVELEQVRNDVENMRRLLRDLQDRRNVRVSLPLRPILPQRAAPLSTHSSTANTLEDIVDMSRCSISSPLRLFIYESPTSPLASALRSSVYSVADPSTACLFLAFHSPSSAASSLAYWGEDGSNHVIVNLYSTPISSQGHEIIVQEAFPVNQFRPLIDYALHVGGLLHADISDWESLPQLLPFSRKNLMLVLAREEWKTFTADAESMNKSAGKAEDMIRVISCRQTPLLCASPADSMGESLFTVLLPSDSFQEDLLDCLKAGSVPVLLSLIQPLPFQDTIDWRLALYRLPLPRFPELHFILRSFSMEDILEMRRKGRIILQNYLLHANVVGMSLLSSLSERLGLPPPPQPASIALPLFNTSFTPPLLSPVTLKTVDCEPLGPLEAPYNSPSFLHNFTSIQMYSYRRWNVLGSASFLSEFTADSVDPPADAEFYEDSSAGFRPIQAGSGKEFALALGGNRQREQFTVILLTYNRDAVLAASLERLNGCPFLNKVVVVWNNVDREPMGAWPRLHVPLEFIRAEVNSLNNRFVPWDRIETEAVLSLDDDIDLHQHEIVFAFRVWRGERERIVGFPARHHARFGDSLFYNSNKTCQMSMILTGAAFIHKEYLHAYTREMPSAIRRHVDSVTNCEDIAMNFLVAHRTRRPPIKTTSRWTLRCPTCSESLWNVDDHFSERHECIRLFTRIYGYNPLRFSQFRADSILFKTKLGANEQKCFRYV